jgi:hypothetical protein
MKAARSIVAVGALAGLLGAPGAIIGCNTVLGIERAMLEPSEAGADANVVPGDDGGAATSDGADPLTCTNYCAVMMQNCTGLQQEYLSNDVCMKMCGYMARGQFYAPANEPDSVDTLGCRLWHANTAAMHPEVHCRHAGPLGSDLCGGPCEPFCSLDWHFCTDDNGVAVYDGQVTGCESVCTGDGGLPYVRGDSGDIVDPSGSMIEMGNTLNCRLWHLETAIDENLPMTHCPHTGAVSATCQ